MKLSEVGALQINDLGYHLEIEIDRESVILTEQEAADLCDCLRAWLVRD